VASEHIEEEYSVNGETTTYYAGSFSMFQAMLGLAIVLTLVAIGWYVVLKLRGYKDQDRVSQEELLLKFRDLTAQGELSYQEYRNIETLLVKRREDVMHQ
jgi:uncharacterized membrane protein